MKVAAMIVAAIATSAIGFLVFLAWVVFDGMVGFEEVARRTSPDGALDAVVIESNGGATTAYGYFICVLPRGEACDPDDAVATTYDSWCKPSMRGLEAIWDGSATLRLVYLTTRRSVLRDAAPEIDGRRVSVALDPGRCGQPTHSSPRPPSRNSRLPTPN